MLVHRHTDISLLVQIALTLPGVREGMAHGANNLPPRLADQSRTSTSKEEQDRIGRGLVSHRIPVPGDRW